MRRQHGCRYNSLVLVSLIKRGAPSGSFSRFKLYQSRYNVGGHTYNLVELEHGVLRAKGGRPNAPGSMLLTASKFSKSDPRALDSLDSYEPLVTFALASGTMSSPAVVPFTSQDVTMKLEVAVHRYLASHLVIGRKSVKLPKVCPQSHRLLSTCSE